MQFYESEVNMTTGEKNELKKLQRKKEVRRQYEKIAITVGGRELLYGPRTG